MNVIVSGQTRICAGILTDKFLFIISAINYQIWEECRDRSRIHLCQEDVKSDDNQVELLITTL